MPNKLKPNQIFIPCEQALDDEMFPNGIFLFNITRLLEHLRSEHSDIPISDVRVADFPRFSSSLDEAHIDTVDLEKPVVIAEIAPQQYNVIDGHHRMERARRESVTELLLTPEQRRSYLPQDSKQWSQRVLNRWLSVIIQKSIGSSNGNWI